VCAYLLSNQIIGRGQAYTLATVVAELQRSNPGVELFKGHLVLQPGQALLPEIGQAVVLLLLGHKLPSLVVLTEEFIPPDPALPRSRSLRSLLRANIDITLQ